MRVSLPWLGSLWTLIALGCGPKTAAPDEETEGADDSTDAQAEDGDDGDGDGDGDADGVIVSADRDVDILFVIDNSGSMGATQANLAEGFEAFVSALESEGGTNYRIGITTTDDGNPVGGCTTPEKGLLVLSSCRSRLEDFIFQGATSVDAQWACTDYCSEAYAGLEVLPTTTAADPQTLPRPWIESIEGKSNLPDGVSTTEALQCFGPQGINGCGFESHLESMFKALVRFDDPSEASYGFMRSNAVLSVVFVTDEADCSYNPDYASVFTFDGDKVFWPVPDRPTSAICWNAGVECSGPGPVYDECHVQNYAVDGQIVPESSAEDDAVLRPVSRYIGLLQTIEDQKKQVAPGREVYVAAINGVPIGYEDGADIVYQDVTGGTPNDPDYQINFGIGPGCQSALAEAVPPVRLRAFAEAFAVGDERNMFSVCADDYGPALSRIADTIKDQIVPPCMQACVADVDLTTEAVDASCVLEQAEPQPDGTNRKTSVPPCEADGALPDGDDVCFVALTDPGNETADPNDDISKQCNALGWNLEFRIVRREGVPPAPGTTLSASCELSEQPAVDCPNLPD